MYRTLAVDKMDIEKTADLKCISRFLVEKWHVDQIKMKITVSPIASERAGSPAKNHATCVTWAVSRVLPRAARRLSFIGLKAAEQPWGGGRGEAPAGAPPPPQIRAYEQT